jgi:hypothetical protein
MRSTCRILAATGLFALGAAPALAADTFTISGFGNQDYWRSPGNSVDASGDKGTFDNNFIGLDIGARITDRAHFYSQIESSTGGGTFLTWGFVDVVINDDAKLHVGAVKFPIGIYNEYIDVRALEMSIVLPAVYSQDADFVHDAYEGVGLDYILRLGTRGKVLLQGFAGNNYNPIGALSPSVPYPSQAQEGNLQAVTNDERTFGGRVTWETPLSGLRLLYSTDITMIETASAPGQVAGQVGYEPRNMLSVDYVTDRFDVKAEYLRHHVPGQSGFADLSTHAWYVQAGYLDLGNWTPYLQYDSVVTDGARASDPSYYERDIVLGVNYRIVDGVNFRVEEHLNHGYALPVASGYTQAEHGSPTWSLFAASVNFIF